MDHIGRENTMGLAFALEGVAMAAWLATRSDPMLFVLLSGLVFFGWGEIFSLFLSTLTDSFGTRFATRNYGRLYMAQGISAIFGGPMASLLHAMTGTWTTAFAVAITADLLTAALTVTALKPLRARYRRQMAAEFGTPLAVAPRNENSGRVTSAAVSEGGWDGRCGRLALKVSVVTPLAKVKVIRTRVQGNRVNEYVTNR